MSLQKARALREERATLIEQMKAVSDKAETEGRDLNAEEQAEWDRIDKAAAGLLARANRLEHEHDMEATEDRAGGDIRPGRDDREDRQIDDKEDPEQRKEAHNRAFAKFVAWGMDGLDADERAIMASNARSVSPEMRAQSIGTTTAGGFSVPDEMMRAIDFAMLEFGGLREGATVLRTATGADLPFPTVDDTSNKGSILSENTQDGEQDITFGQTVLSAFMYTSDIVRVSLQLLQDGLQSPNSYMGGVLGERLARIYNEHGTTGTGSSQPNGIVTASTAGVTAVQNNAISHDDLMDLKHSVDPAYRRQNAMWMFNDTTLKALKKLKDDQSRPLWAPGIAVREPDTLDGDRYIINQDMADSAGATKPVIYGALGKYIMREVQDVTLLRLVERYADFLQVGFLAFQRFDGDLIDAGTNPVKHLVHPS